VFNRRSLVLSLSLALFAAQAPCQVSAESLLREMADLDRLARAPKPRYSAAQASSFDRAAKSPADNWFANADYGKYLREETNGGRREYVMADLEGPGAVVRIWSANPDRVLRFYFDGESEPRLEAPMADLLNGRHPLFPDPFAYNASSGTNLYFPFPFQKSLKITVDDPAGDRHGRIYYHVNYRTYAAGTKVRTYRSDDPQRLARLMAQVAATLLDPKAGSPERGATGVAKAKGRVGTLGNLTCVAKGEGAVVLFRARVTIPDTPPESEDLPWDSPLQLHNALRTLRLVGTFDGERCIDAPLGDFFGSAPGLNPFATFPMRMSEDGWMECRFVMPFAGSGEFRVTNFGSAPVFVEIEAYHGPHTFGAGSYHFHAQWLGQRCFTRPMKDVNFLSVGGEGRWVGSNLHIANPVGTWWGEGDEKVYVDGETFPSTFGTGTEDYYGYAWGSPKPFARPYHAQPRCDGPGSLGHTSVNRWHVIDDIPYRSSFRFDLELWHWAEVNVSFDHTSYWYARPGGTLPNELSLRGLLPVEIERPKPVKGALEGESMAIIEKSGGVTEVQDFGELSNGKQLWWRDAKPGDKLVLRFRVREAGDYEITGNFCKANDYGTHRFRLNGAELGVPVDFYSSTLKWETLSLGAMRLDAGEATLEVLCAGKHPSALPRHMFGLDYILLKTR
jgi:hypothetical protein